MKCQALLLTACYLIFAMPSSAQSSATPWLRPAIHFTPAANWMNDPNGMVYYNGVYHLFFQYHPYSMVWGPMHWGHATSTDLVKWKEQPVKLYPDSLGYIFSGSAVVDVNNTSGFGVNEQPPLVAIFTHHNDTQDKQGRNDFQNQSLAYSNDNGKTWTKYSGNPVVRNPGIRDFRDPKVMWYTAQKKWMMTLAVQNRVMFYSSPNLKDWTFESEFGKDAGAHGGVWECPDLFAMQHNGKMVWILFVSINPGAANGGSGTQYFLGDFDGKHFKPYDQELRWLDYGPDNYAGVTWSNTGNRTVFIGWMSNWDYAQQVPTSPWRSGMTIARELKLHMVNGKYYVASTPVKELDAYRQEIKTEKDIASAAGKTMSIDPGKPMMLALKADAAQDMEISLTNSKQEVTRIGYDCRLKKFYIDRRQSGSTGFHQSFARMATAPRLATGNTMELKLLYDAGSVELFADDGLTCMTALCFPTTPYSELSISAAPASIQHLSRSILKGSGEK